MRKTKWKKGSGIAYPVCNGKGFAPFSQMLTSMFPFFQHILHFPTSWHFFLFFFTYLRSTVIQVVHVVISVSRR